MRISITPTWGIRIMAAWSLVLAVLAASHLLLLTLAVELYQGDNQLRIWVIFALNLLFCVGFGAAGYGMWLHQGWGRVAFLWLIAVWSAFNFMGLFAPGLMFNVTHSFWQMVQNGLRFSAALIIPLVYLNLPRIKAQFEPAAPQNFTSEDTSHNDT
jgi:hypothetical protein